MGDAMAEMMARCQAFARENAKTYEQREAEAQALEKQAREAQERQAAALKQATEAAEKARVDAVERARKKAEREFADAELLRKHQQKMAEVERITMYNTVKPPRG